MVRSREALPAALVVLRNDDHNMEMNVIRRLRPILSRPIDRCLAAIGSKKYDLPSVRPRIVPSEHLSGAQVVEQQ